MQVLIVKMSSMGDVIHTLPAVTDAMMAIPAIRFAWVVEEAFVQIPGWHPAVVNIIPVAMRRWRRHWWSTRHERREFKRILQEHRYDIVIDAQGLIKSAALVTRMARGNKHGQDCKSAREPIASWFYQYPHRIDRQQHAVERTRELFAQSLGYNKPHTAGDYAIAQRFLKRLPLDAGRYLVFLHSSARAEKHWPETHWRQLLIHVQSTGLNVKLPWGTEEEHQRALRLATGFTHVEVLPRLSLQQLADVLAGAKVIISIDTGLSHLAAALDRPNITLFGPTDPQLIGGYGGNQYVCRSEYGQNMKDIAPINVMNLLSNLFNCQETSCKTLYNIL